ncbi:MAG: LUD domain-containing protein [Oceanospirillaceae bacterium]|nr:LUD domain-containing protein [Oceanospirillaceae bacterium]
MSTAKQQILGRIRSGLKRGPLNEQQQAILSQKLTSRSRTIQPARAKVTGQTALDDFKAMAIEVATEIVELASLEQLPQTMNQLMKDSNLTQQPLVLANEPDLVALPWAHAGITTDIRVSTKGDSVSLTNSLCGVAETGTLVLRSSPNSPTTLNLFPDLHCAVLHKDSIVAGYEDAWDWVRDGGIPRTVNFITGPSRSADLEQTLRMGAHGPKRLVIFLV